MNFSVIIPNYNGAGWLWYCLAGIDKNRANHKGEIEVIMVDNGSTDGSRELFLKWGKGVLIENKENTGFAAAINLGEKKAKYNWIVALNNDVVLDKNWFREMSLAALRHEGECFGGTVLNFKGDKIESRGLEFNKKGRCWNIGNGEKFNWKKLSQLKAKKVWGISGAALLISREVFKKIGGMDEDYFAYEEDMDLAWRLRVWGYSSYWVPTAISFHVGGATSSRMGNLRARMDNRNWIWFMVKNYSKETINENMGGILKERLRNLAYLARETVKIYGFRSVFYLPWSYLWLLGSTFKGLGKMIKKRQQIRLLLQSNMRGQVL